MGKRTAEETRAAELRAGLVEPTAQEKERERNWIPAGMVEAGHAELARRQQEETKQALREPGLVPTSDLQKAVDRAQTAVPPTTREALWDGTGFDRAMPNPLAIPPLTDPVGHARDLALAAAEICRSKSLLPQSRVQAIRLLNMAIAVLGT